MLHCRNCGNNWPEVVPKAVPPKHCPKCGAPAVVRTSPPEGRDYGQGQPPQNPGYQGPSYPY